jgi:drug/metabolite transporter (DMT)-like permease
VVDSVFSCFGSVLTFYCLYLCTAKSSAEISSVYAYINPIIAVLLGAAIFGETLNAAIAIGGGVTLFGLYLVNYSLRKGRTKSKSIKKTHSP